MQEEADAITLSNEEIEQRRREQEEAEKRAEAAPSLLADNDAGTDITDVVLGGK